MRTYIPERAHGLLPLVEKEALRITPEFPKPAYYGALIEHESCISLKHSRCWSPTSELKTAREQGSGLGQITRAFNKDGSVRFDALSDMVKRHNGELKELSWLNVKSRPDLQIRTIVLMTRDNCKYFRTVANDWERLAMCDSSYNGGVGSVVNARRVCGLKENCDSDKWFGHTELHLNKSRKPLYAGRSPYQIVVEHVKDVMYVRLPKYEIHFNGRKEL